MGMISPAGAEGLDWASKGELLVSVGFNYADVMKETSLFTSERTGSETGTVFEGAFCYPLGSSFAVEAGLMTWSIAGFDGSGVTASAIYQPDDASQYGLGIIPEGIRIFGCYYFGRSQSGDRRACPYGQIAWNFNNRDEVIEVGEVSLDSWASFSIGYAF
jgi:hypothetical protein